MSITFHVETAIFVEIELAIASSAIVLKCCLSSLVNDTCTVTNH